MATLAVFTRLGYPAKLLWASCMNTFLTASGDEKYKKLKQFSLLWILHWWLCDDGEKHEQTRKIQTLLYSVFYLQCLWVSWQQVPPAVWSAPWPWTQRSCSWWSLAVLFHGISLHTPPPLSQSSDWLKYTNFYIRNLMMDSCKPVQNVVLTFLPWFVQVDYPFPKLSSERRKDVEPVSTLEFLSRCQADDIMSECCHFLWYTCDGRNSCLKVFQVYLSNI